MITNHKIPIIKTIVPMHNNQRDGHMRQEINVVMVSYQPNSLGYDCPFHVKIDDGGFSSFNKRVEAYKASDRSENILDYFGQAALFLSVRCKQKKSYCKCFAF